MTAMMECTRAYFRNLHKQSDLHSKPDKLEETCDKGRSQAHRQGVGLSSFLVKNAPDELKSTGRLGGKLPRNTVLTWTFRWTR